MTKHIELDPETNDYSYSYNGALIGFAPTARIAEQKLDAYVYDLLQSESQTDLSALDAEDIDDVIAAGELLEPAPTVMARLITREKVQRVLDSISQVSPRWLNAAKRAVEELAKGRWMWDGSRLKIESRSTPGTYHIATAAACDEKCTAWNRGEPCFHRAGVRILQRASQV